MLSSEEIARAEVRLAIEPLMADYFIDIAKGWSSWRDHQDKLDVALAVLSRDEPYSLRYMSPPPIRPEVSEEVMSSWYADHPAHPMADDDRARTRRHAGHEIVSWSRFAPQAFSSPRRASLHRCLADCDASVRYELLRAVGFLDNEDARDALQELVQIETESPFCKAMAVVLLHRFSRD